MAAASHGAEAGVSREQRPCRRSPPLELPAAGRRRAGRQPAGGAALPGGRGPAPAAARRRPLVGRGGRGSAPVSRGAPPARARCGPRRARSLRSAGVVTICPSREKGAPARRGQTAASTQGGPWESHQSRCSTCLWLRGTSPVSFDSHP